MCRVVEELAESTTHQVLFQSEDARKGLSSRPYPRPGLSPFAGYGSPSEGLVKAAYPQLLKLLVVAVKYRLI